jgi:hypothetical protein
MQESNRGVQWPALLTQGLAEDVWCVLSRKIIASVSLAETNTAGKASILYVCKGAQHAKQLLLM